MTNSSEAKSALDWHLHLELQPMTLSVEDPKKVAPAQSQCQELEVNQTSACREKNTQRKPALSTGLKNFCVLP